MGHWITPDGIKPLKDEDKFKKDEIFERYLSIEDGRLVNTPKRYDDLRTHRVHICRLDKNHPDFERMFELAKLCSEEIFY